MKTKVWLNGEYYDIKRIMLFLDRGRGGFDWGRWASTIMRDHNPDCGNKWRGRIHLGERWTRWE